MKTNIYLHSNKEQNCEIGEKLGLNEEAMGHFIYACHEVKLTLQVEKNGKYEIIEINNNAIIKR